MIGFLNFQTADEKVNNIEFTYHSARRIPFNEVKISINRARKNNNAKLYVHCEPLKNDPKWNYSKIDTVYTIDIQTFEKLASSVKSLEKINLDKAYAEGLDGHTCTIRYGGMGKNISYGFWVPSDQTEKRGLTEFMSLCEEIIKLAELKKEDVLER